MDSAFENEVAALMVDTLNLDVEPGEIGPEEPLFGGESPLELDSIDALELGLIIHKTYGVRIKPEDERIQEIFASLRALSRHVQSEMG